MGPSMSNPDKFKHLNQQRHLLEYERKHRTQISLDSKIKLKKITSFPSNHHREISQHKNILINQEKSPQSQSIPVNAKNISNQNQQELIESIETPKNAAQNQQNSAEIHKKNQDNEHLNKKIKIQKPDQSLLLNSQSKKIGIRKIVLNNQAYQIDIEKMKNRRLKSKERYSKIIISNGNNAIKSNVFNSKPSFMKNSVPKNVSTLELQSQLNNLIQQTIKMEAIQEHIELQNSNGLKMNQKVKESPISEYNQTQKVRAQYYDDYLGSFESKSSQRYQQKVKKSVLDKKLMKAHNYIQKQKGIKKIEEIYSLEQYQIRSEKKIFSKKSQNTASSIQTSPQPQIPLFDSQQNHKKPIKLIKVHKNKNQSSRLSLNL